jgi:hypothetical protein
MNFNTVKIETFIPPGYINKLREHLNDAGALTIDGRYDYCMAVSKVTGSWRPLEGANPFMGKTGEICEAEEIKVEFCCSTKIYKIAVDIIKKIHPYERPVINVIPLIDSDLQTDLIQI